MTFDDATRAQIRAARPDASTWLSANAGSGKTRVLTDRVARLLLNETLPQHILCLTYTKAAASEMQNRLFKRLGAWAMLEDDALRHAMVELGIDGKLSSEQLRKARTLFALAIETPGGLKIQTIHSFCASLLRRFPLEAEVSPQFTEIEDRAADLLRTQIVDEMAEGPEAALIADLAGFYTGEDFGKLTASIVRIREAFDGAITFADLLEKLGQPRDLNAGNLAASVFLGSEKALLETIIPHLIAKGGNDAKAGVALQSLGPLDGSALPLLENTFLYGSTAKAPFAAKVDRFPTKQTQGIIADDLPALHDFMLRVEDAREPRMALQTAQMAVALHAFARAFLDRYAAAKLARGWLDFDDLILKARALLRDRNVAAWVLFRIDGGIDHILVDEAQDTSARQWDVIEALADEFHSGAGARSDVNRTLFVVGDKKQSIYSFQGADPLEFDRKRILFDKKFKQAKQPFHQSSLDYSFRSSGAILRLVDTVFDPNRRPDFDKQSEHIPFKDLLPGRVDLWPLIEKGDKDESRPWTDPVDRPSPQRPNVVLAEKIAAQIKRLTDPDTPSYIPDDGDSIGSVIKRPIRPKDFLILVQRRSDLFAEIIRACKAAQLPIAGADRLRVGAEIAVKDLGALLSFLATPDDDLSLATALKSPLLGWDEKMLFRLAHKRTQKHLWQALRTFTTDHPETLGMLTDLRNQVDFLRPYDLIERILTRHNGRKKLLSRLGPEAEDGINAMLTQALAYERNAVPSLTGFLEWMQTDDLEIKRQIDSASDQIRVMTVHGSKGLEAPIVILPETQKRDVRLRDEIIAVDGVPLWKPRSDDMPPVLQARGEEIKDAERAERLRLLYVAMTRAEKWLIVAAAGDVAPDKSDWYSIIHEAMSHNNAIDIDGAGTLRFQQGDWNGLEAQDTHWETSTKAVLDPLFAENPPIFAHRPAVLSPSDLGGAKALASEDGAEQGAAMAYGTLVHDLLEKLSGLPAEERAESTRALQSQGADDTLPRACAEVERVMTAPALSHLFQSNALMEIPVTATLGGQRLHGIIDRLVIDADQILLVDYKTNRQVPTTAEACPEGLLRQMGAYAAMLAQIYPAHRIQPAILWTATASLMPLSHDAVTTALWRSPYLDAAQGRS